MLNKNPIINYSILFFVYAVCIGGYVPYAVLYLRNLGVPNDIISLISIIVPACAIVGQPLLGRLADRLKNPNILLSALIMIIVLCIGILTRFASTIIVAVSMCLIAIANGVAYSIITAHLIIYLKSQHKLKRFSTIRLLYAIGYSSVSLLMSFLLNDNLDMAFNISVAFGIVSVIIAQSINWNNSETIRNKSNLRHVFKSRELSALIIFSFLMSISCSQTFVYMPLLYKEMLISDKMFALSMVILIFSEIPVFLIFSKMYVSIDVYKIYFLPLISIILRTLILSYSNNIAIIIASNTLNGLGFVLIQMTITMYSKNKVDENELSTIQSVISSVIYSGARLVSSIAVILLISKHSIKHIQRLNAMYMLGVFAIYLLYLFAKRKELFNANNI